MANEKRLIDANIFNQAYKFFKKHMVAGDSEFLQGYEAGLLGAYNAIAQIKTVDTVEVVHGRWEYGKWEQGHWVKGNERCRCSVCHRDFAVDNLNIWHGCPQCMAKMDGERKGNE